MSKRPTGDHRKKIIEELLTRDGPNCCFCGQDLNGDITLEHWLSASDGGNNTLANTALAHSACNTAAGNLPIMKKVELRDRLRNALSLIDDLDVHVNASDLVQAVA